MSAEARSLNQPVPRVRECKAGPLPANVFQRSDWKGLCQFAAHAGSLGLTGTLVAASRSTSWSVAAMLLHGVVLACLFAPLHECVHRTAFNSRRLNDAIGFFCGFVLLLPGDYFRSFHLAHHRNTQDPECDPELAVRKPETRSEYLLHLSGLPYWRERVTTLVRHAMGTAAEPFIEEPKRSMIVREARLHLVLYGLAGAIFLAFQSGTLIIYWLAPVVLGQPFLRAFLLAEHAGCPMIPDMLRNSRTTHTNFLVKFLTWNMPYHAEHHAWAAVPFHALPQVHALAQGEIAVQAPGYIALHCELLRQVRDPGVGSEPLVRLSKRVEREVSAQAPSRAGCAVRSPRQYRLIK